MPKLSDLWWSRQRRTVAELAFAIKVDRDAIEQAILNLLNNAMKYSGKSREIGLRLARQNGNALIQITDHSIGIPAGGQRRIFEKFYRCGTAGSEHRGMSGQAGWSHGT